MGVGPLPLLQMASQNPGHVFRRPGTTSQTTFENSLCFVADTDRRANAGGDRDQAIALNGAHGHLIWPPANQPLHLTGPALRFSETSRSLQPVRQVKGVVRPPEG